MEQIDRDVKRTHPDMHFFCGDSSFAKSNQVNLNTNSVVRSLSDLFFLLFLPGIFEKCTVNLCQAECWNKICTRDE
jgi:hypothetical protein